MSKRDIRFIRSLAVNGSEVARMLDVSRQSVSKGLRGDSDYFDKTKLRRIAEIVPKVLDVETEKVAELINKIYPDYKDEIYRLSVEEKFNITIDGDMYVSCMRLSYYMGTYKKLFSDLAGYILQSPARDIFFAFPNQETLRYNRPKLLSWLRDEAVIKRSYVTVCPTIEVFPFAICGETKGDPAVYLCEDGGFARLSRANSSLVVNFIRRFLSEHEKRVKALKPM